LISLQPEVAGARVGAGVEVILYTGRAGAFVDLAADLAWLTGRGMTDVPLDQHLGVVAEPDGASGGGCVAYQPGDRGV
jgi:hypothetical protein